MYRPVLVMPPTIKPVTLTEAKAALDIGYAEKDTLISGLIAAATSHLDGWTGVLGRVLCEQTWRQDYDGFVCWSANQIRQCGDGYLHLMSHLDRSSFGCAPTTRLRIPLAPVISIASVKYTDTVGVEQTVDPVNYILRNDDSGPYVEFFATYTLPAVGSDGGSVRVAYVAGYANAGADPNFTSTVPDGIKQAMFLLIRQWFDNPTPVIVGSTVEKMPYAVDALLGQFRRIQF